LQPKIFCGIQLRSFIHETIDLQTQQDLQLRMEFKKLNKIQSLLLKLRDREAYKDYKFLKGLQNVQHPFLQPSLGPDVYFKHSGNAGDLIYSLPAMFALGPGRNIHLCININQKNSIAIKHHPLGNLMLNEKMFEMLHPLLASQLSIKSCEIYNNQPIDFDLDLFRQYPFNYKMGNISRWYFLVFGINADLGKPWLTAPPDASMHNAIVLARSLRYHAPGIRYDFLQQYPRTVFIGVEKEYEEMKKTVPNIEYKPVKDFLEMANVIAGSKFFIGNQSFPFSIAEGLKTKRLLEVYHQSPNVIVEGAQGYDFCYQPQFEKLVEHLYREG